MSANNTTGGGIFGAPASPPVITFVDEDRKGFRRAIAARVMASLVADLRRNDTPIEVDARFAWRAADALIATESERAP